MKNLRESEKLFSRLYLPVLLALLAFGSAWAQNPGTGWYGHVGAEIDSLLESSMFETSQVGMCIYDLTADSLIYSHDDRQTMRPASTQKLITAITALDVMGDRHKFETFVGYTGDINERTLDGDLYIKGGFDPLLSDSDVSYIARSIKEHGIDTIRGSILFDRSFKDNSEMGEGWCWDDDNPSLLPITVNGKNLFYECLSEALIKNGVSADARTGFSICPDTAVMVVKTSHSLFDVLHKMMKESDNFHAEAVFYSIASTRNSRWASAKDAVSVIDSLIAVTGHRRSEYRIADGSGLSLYNYTTARIETDLLRYAYSKKDIFEILYLTLPVAGKDGTLKARMRDNKFAMGNVRAKTGSVSCVSSLAGFCRAHNGHDIAFTIINQGVIRTRKARDFQDKVCAILCAPVTDDNVTK